MKIFYSTEEIDNQKNYVATIGTFDGVHLGHKMILRALKQRSEEFDFQSVLITFYPHPRIVLNENENNLNLLNTQDEKLDLLEKAGVDNVLLQEFTNEFSQMDAKAFVHEYLLKKLNVKHLILGYDHSFGKKVVGRQPNIEALLTEAGISFTIIPKQEVDSISISSTKIRKAILEGDITTANEYLGYTFNIKGKVVEGEKTGRSIGFPTANVQLTVKDKIAPAIGVYAVNVCIDNRIYKGMLNYGKKPTIGERELGFEVHIFDFDLDIYDKEIQLFFLRKIRDEKKFDNLEELKIQLESDKKAVLAITF